MRVPYSNSAEMILLLLVPILSRAERWLQDSPELRFRLHGDIQSVTNNIANVYSSRQRIVAAQQSRVFPDQPFDATIRVITSKAGFNLKKSKAPDV
ncbi:MAG: hypothetical protein HOP00_13490 [Nitrospira sp.]|nr:hypothetical protein [Nitrospira sp.]